MNSLTPKNHPFLDPWATSRGAVNPCVGERQFFGQCFLGYEDGEGSWVDDRNHHDIQWMPVVKDFRWMLMWMNVNMNVSWCFHEISMNFNFLFLNLWMSIAHIDHICSAGPAPALLPYRFIEVLWLMKWMECDCVFLGMIWDDMGWIVWTFFCTQNQSLLCLFLGRQKGKQQLAIWYGYGVNKHVESAKAKG